MFQVVQVRGGGCCSQWVGGGNLWSVLRSDGFIRQLFSHMMQACAMVGEYHACDWVLDNAEELRVTVGNDTIPSMMRKVAGSGADLPEVERLYRLEKPLRGSNSNAGRGV